MAIEAILFDLDDTLLVDEAATDEVVASLKPLVPDLEYVKEAEWIGAVRESARKHWRQSECHAYCVQVGISSMEGLRGEFEGCDPHLEKLRAWKEEYRYMVWSDALACFGLSTSAMIQQLGDNYAHSRRTSNILFEDALPALTDLGQTCALALVTNGAPDLQMEKVQLAGLEEYFDAIVISGSLGVGKPLPRPFEVALESLSVEPCNALMVGNSLERDMAGALASGITSVWLDRDAGFVKSSIEPEHIITSLNALRSVLETENDMTCAGVSVGT